MKKFNRQTALRLANILRIDLRVVPIKEWQYGLNVELEHGYMYEESNITNDDPILTAKIALAHLLEYPDYYKRLKRMEEQAEKYWSRRTKKNIFAI